MNSLKKVCGRNWQKIGALKWKRLLRLNKHHGEYTNSLEGGLCENLKIHSYSCSLNDPGVPPPGKAISPSTIGNGGELERLLVST